MDSLKEVRNQKWGRKIKTKKMTSKKRKRIDKKKQIQEKSSNSYLDGEVHGLELW